MQLYKAGNSENRASFEIDMDIFVDSRWWCMSKSSQFNLEDRGFLLYLFLGEGTKYSTLSGIFYKGNSIWIGQISLSILYIRDLNVLICPVPLKPQL